MKIIFVFILLLFTSFSVKENKSSDMRNSEKQRLAVVWTSGDPEVAEKVCFMYTDNAKLRGWFDEVVLIVWGPSAKLLAENKMIQEGIKKMMADGVKVEACVTCANMYGVADQLKSFGIDVKPMGSVLSDYLKEGWKVLTF